MAMDLGDGRKERIMYKTSSGTCDDMMIQARWSRDMESPIAHLVKQFGPVLLDGSIGAYLQQDAQYASLASGSMWSARLIADAPHVLYQLHKAYLDAGARIVCTATYQLSQYTLDKAGLSDHTSVHDLFVKGIGLVQDAIQGHGGAKGSAQPCMAISLGSWGAMLGGGKEYTGDYGGLSMQELRQFYVEQISLAVQCAQECGCKIDDYVLAFETIPSMMDVLCIVDAMRMVPASPSAWISLYCTHQGTVGDGTDVRKVAQVLVQGMHRQLAMLSVNCAPPSVCSYSMSLIQSVLDSEHAPLYGCYPNGREWDDANHCWQQVEDEDAHAQQWALETSRLHVQVYGGCCMTTPQHIRLLQQQLYNHHHG